VSDDILEAAAKLTDRARMLVVKDRAELVNIKQFYVILGKDKAKLQRLSVLLKAAARMQSVVFCVSRRKVDWIKERLRLHGFDVVTIVSDSTHFDGCGFVTSLTA
jgi:ATP-dependent RNA helicase